MLTKMKTTLSFYLFIISFCFIFAACEPSKPPRNVILITIDTLRPDHLSCYGYNRITSPSIDRIASEGVRYDNVFCQLTSTTPSHCSILTGLSPATHGVLANWEPLPPEFNTLAEILKGTGFRTGAVVSNWSLKKERGLDQGFDFYDDFLPEQELNRPLFFKKDPEDTTKSALEWLDKNKEKPFFLFINYMDPHGPYTPPPPYNNAFAVSRTSATEVLPFSEKNDAPHAIPAYQRLGEATNPAYYVSQYDGEIQYTDYWLGKLIEKIKDWGLLDTTLIIVTSDHGESLGEHDYYFMHSNLTYKEQASVPLIIRFPPLFRAGKVVHTRIEGMDLMPTILQVCGISYKGKVEGQSFLRVEKEKNSNPVTVLSESARMISVYKEPWELVILEKKPIELYNLTLDPLEKRNVLETSDPETQQSLFSIAAKYFNQPRSNKKSNIKEEDKETLRSLGYIN